MESLCFVQNSIELKFILSQRIDKKNVIFVPLNFGSLLDCAEKKTPIYKLQFNFKK